MASARRVRQSAIPNLSTSPCLTARVCVQDSVDGSSLTKSIYTFVLPKSIAAQIRQRILHHHPYKEQVDAFVRELTFARRLGQHLL
jgi:hypothetical protein